MPKLRRHVREEGLTLADRHGRAIVCGRCGAVAIAEAHADGALTFPLDAHRSWKGWKRADAGHVDAPGGTWRLAPAEMEKRPALHELLDTLPAVIQCPGCGADNLFDPKRLGVRALQLVVSVHAAGGKTAAG